MEVQTKSEVADRDVILGREELTLDGANEIWETSERLPYDKNKSEG